MYIEMIQIKCTIMKIICIIAPIMNAISLNYAMGTVNYVCLIMLLSFDYSIGFCLRYIISIDVYSPALL
jgi:hypothetical protein